MAWLFFGLIGLFVGAGIEGATRQSPALRPAPTVSGIWYLMGKITAVGIIGAFIAAFFVFPWWLVLASFVIAFVLSAFVTERVKLFGAAPAISMTSLLAGGGMTTFGLLTA